jgi:hypothetical protein
VVETVNGENRALIPPGAQSPGPDVCSASAAPAGAEICEDVVPFSSKHERRSAASVSPAAAVAITRGVDAPFLIMDALCVRVVWTNRPHDQHDGALRPIDKVGGDAPLYTFP